MLTKRCDVCGNYKTVYKTKITDPDGNKIEFHNYEFSPRTPQICIDCAVTFRKLIIEKFLSGYDIKTNFKVVE